MLEGFVAPGGESRPLRLLRAADYEGWKAARPETVRSWLEFTAFEPVPGRVALHPGGEGEPAGAVLILSDPPTLWDVAAAAEALPPRTFAVEDPEGLLDAEAVALGWALASYRFTRYRRDDRPRPLLALRPPARARILAEAVFLARDLVNTPASDLGPAELADAASDLAREFGAEIEIPVGEELRERNYPAVWAVGRASDRAPRLIDLRWGEANRPKLTLVGKGVCFDTGGLDLKPASAMRLMKKDMGGAALMLGLARAVMAAELPVRLRLLVPAVENAVGGAAFRPGDVLATRKGLTVEVGNTDAEGRLVLADALAEADGEKPDLLLDAATLTGAARVALGPELPALFTPDEELAASLLAKGEALAEPLWRLPLHGPYARMIESRIADLDNAGAKPFAGAITAALFLRRFVTETAAWAHLDVFAWNDEARPGRPRGGEASGLRPLFALLEERFGEGGGRR
ncbi:MAG TPA: leucyl aminopeptidase family protein [Rhodospirillales bacterium]|nr:leucyl aminopeptidase family protein [Rhodospirillales bacterium]